jgi:hypothetical protein
MSLQIQMQLDETLDALKNAEAAGDTDSARILADRASRLKQEVESSFAEEDKSSKEGSQRVSDSPITAAAVGAVGGAILGKPTERLAGKVMGATYKPYGNVATGEPSGWKWDRKTGFGAGLGETVQEQSEEYKRRMGPQKYNQPKQIRSQGQMVETKKIPGKALTIEQSMANAERDALEARVKAEASKNAGKGAFWKAPSGFGPQVATVAGKAIGGAGALGMGAQAALDFDKMVEALKKKEYAEAAKAARSGGLSAVGALGSAATFIPHPVAKGVGTALGVAAPLANAYLESKGYAQGGPAHLARGGGDALKKASKFIFPPSENSGLTQIPGTIPTYRKADKILNDLGAEGLGIDYGAGLGKGAKVMSGEFQTFEPFHQNKWKPDFVNPKDIPSDAYGRLVNLNVLNVLNPEARAEAVKNMGRVMQPGGTGIVTTRGMDVMRTKSGHPGPEPTSFVTGKGTYQKGFMPTELEDYLKYMLGQGYNIDRLGLGPAGALIRKKADGGLSQYAEGGKTAAWQRKEGKNPEGGLNAKGRASYKAETGGTLKRPQPEGGARRDSFCARMTGMKKKLTSAETANDPDSRINKSLRKWNC